jgi:SAM-dependent methyltransferase
VSAAEERLGHDPTSELWGEHRSRYHFAASFLTRGLRVLDVACGSGFGLELLEERGLQALGVDYDPAALADSRAWRHTARLTRADATRLPLVDACVDAVVSFETIEHVPDARALVFEVRRVLKEGGCLVLSTPNRLFRASPVVTNPFHVREFTADELRGLLREAFARVELYGQLPSDAYRYVPFRMVHPHYEPAALTWRALVRLPFGVRNSLALALSGRPFYPGEADYRFPREATAGSHALLAVAR